MSAWNIHTRIWRGRQKVDDGGNGMPAGRNIVSAFRKSQWTHTDSWTILNLGF